MVTLVSGQYQCNIENGINERFVRVTSLAVLFRNVLLLSQQRRIDIFYPLTIPNSSSSSSFGALGRCPTIVRYVAIDVFRIRTNFVYFFLGPGRLHHLSPPSSDTMYFELLRFVAGSSVLKKLKKKTINRDDNDVCRK